MINRGTIFEQRAASVMARLRQIVLANPAISRQRIVTEFNQRHRQNLHASAVSTPVTSSVTTTQMVAQAIAALPTKNCPTCALHCYHSTVFNLPWVTRCPIHGEALTTHCPQCLHPWSTERIKQGVRCDYCGIPDNMARCFASTVESDEGYAVLHAFANSLETLCRHLEDCVA